MKKKNITIDDLAVMVQRGFGDITDTMATKSEIVVLRSEINKRFDHLEKSILDDYRSRIEKLEMKVEYLENVLNLHPKRS